MAAAGLPMRTLQEFMGHRDIATTQRYADYAPSAREAELVAAAFARGRATRVFGSPCSSSGNARIFDPATNRPEKSRHLGDKSNCARSVRRSPSGFGHTGSVTDSDLGEIRR